MLDPPNTITALTSLLCLSDYIQTPPCLSSCQICELYKLIGIEPQFLVKSYPISQNREGQP